MNSRDITAEHFVQSAVDIQTVNSNGVINGNAISTSEVTPYCMFLLKSGSYSSGNVKVKQVEFSNDNTFATGVTIVNDINRFIASDSTNALDPISQATLTAVNQLKKIGFSSPVPNLSYIISATILQTGGNDNLYIYKNGLKYKMFNGESGASAFSTGNSRSVFLKQGETASIGTDNSIAIQGSSSQPYISSIDIIGVGANQIIATEPLYACQLVSDNVPSLYNTFLIMNKLDPLVRDTTGGAYNNSTGEFISPVNRKYQIDFSGLTNGIGAGIYMQIYKNGIAQPTCFLENYLQ